MLKANCYCLAPYQQYSDKCHLYNECVRPIETPATWNDARSICKASQSTHATIFSHHKHLYLTCKYERKTKVYYFLSFAAIARLPFWIGLKYRANTASYYWDDGNDEQSSIQVIPCIPEIVLLSFNNKHKIVVSKQY